MKIYFLVKYKNQMRDIPHEVTPIVIYLYKLSRWKLFKLLLANIMFSVLSLELRLSIWHCFCFLLLFRSVCVELWIWLNCRSRQHLQACAYVEQIYVRVCRTKFVPFMEISRRKLVSNPFLLFFSDSIYIPNGGSIWVHSCFRSVR